MAELILSFLDEFRKNFRAADAVDILLMSILLYSALLWFRQTTSRRVLIGVTVLVVVYFLARTLDMHLTSLVFHTGFAVLLIMLIVVFQEDLRRMFENVAAWGSLSRLRRERPLSTDSDTLVEAAFAMASQRTGALMVVRGSEPLERHLNGGIWLDGELSKPLIYSIFDSSSPGHDGATIIHRDRIEQFAAHLPISKDQKEIAGRGTRHSAALGLSERCDALVVVVSEERGVVSVAERGRLKEMQSAAALKGRLERFLASNFPSEDSRPWRRYLLEDWRLKMFAIALATAAWFVLAYKPSTIQRTFVVPIEYRNLSENLLLDEDAPDEARVTLAGSEQNFRFLEPANLAISLDLADATSGSHQMSITQKNIRLPANLQVYRIEPRFVPLLLRQKPPKETGKSVPVQSGTQSATD